MFESGIRQLRMAISMAAGRRLDTANIGRLIHDLVATVAEFGEPGADAEEVLGSSMADPKSLQELTSRGLRRTARRLAAQSAFYARRFAAADVGTDKFALADLRAIPVTTKRDLIERAGDFRCADVPAHLVTRTTGTTGRPAEVWLSRYEMELWPALAALSSLLQDALRSGDVMQVNMSSRAIAANHLTAATCRLAGAACKLDGIVAPEEAVASLVDARVTVLSTYPSYLAELVTAARRLGVGPGDLSLRRVTVGGEVLSPSLATAGCQTLGVPHIDDVYSITEAIPVAGRACGHGHLHHDVNQGLTEVLGLASSEPAAPGELGTLVITPFFPYRDCMPVFRYDTRDLVRCLPSEPLSCELAGLPATSQVLGKAEDLLCAGPAREVTPRQLIDAIEALPTQPWPARYRADVRDGRIQLAVPAAAVNGLGEGVARRHFADAGLDIDLAIVADDLLPSLRRTRGDLREASFGGQQTLVGA